MGFWDNAGSALLSGAAGLVGGLFGLKNTSDVNDANIRAVRETNKANRELAQYNWEQQRQMWNEKNAYDSPIQQMARLKEAGLNPNLVYGSIGNMSGQAPTPAMPTQEAPHSERSDYGFIAQSANAAMQSYLQQKQIDSQVELNKSQQTAIESNNMLNKARAAEALSRSAKTKQEFEQSSALWSNTVAAANLALKNSQTDYDRKQQDLQDWPLRRAQMNASIELMRANKNLSYKNAEKISQDILESAARIVNLQKDLSVKDSQIASNYAAAAVSKSVAEFNNRTMDDRISIIAQDLTQAIATGHIKEVESRMTEEYGLSKGELSNIFFNLVNKARKIFGKDFVGYVRTNDVQKSDK